MTDMDKAKEAELVAEANAAEDELQNELDAMPEPRDSDAAILENDAHNGFTDEPNVVLSGN